MASESETSPRQRLDKHSARDRFLLLGLQFGWFEETHSNIINKLTKEIVQKYETSLFEDLEREGKQNRSSFSKESLSKEKLSMSFGSNSRYGTNSENSSILEEMIDLQNEVSSDSEYKQFNSHESIDLEEKNYQESNVEDARPSSNLADDNSDDVNHLHVSAHHEDIRPIDYSVDDNIDDHNHSQVSTHLEDVRFKCDDDNDNDSDDDIEHSYVSAPREDVRPKSDLSNDDDENHDDGINNSYISAPLEDEKPKTSLVANFSDEQKLSGDTLPVNDQACNFVDETNHSNDLGHHEGVQPDITGLSNLDSSSDSLSFVSCESTFSQDCSPLKKLNFTPDDENTNQGKNDAKDEAMSVPSKGSMFTEVTSPEDFISPSPPRLSLREKLLKKYNPERSTGGLGELGLFSNSGETPKNVTGTASKKNRIDLTDEVESDSDDVFIVNDFDDDYDDDEDFKKEKKDVPTPTATASKSAKKKPVSKSKRNQKYESCGYSSGQVTPECAPRNSLDSVITPYSTQKEFKKGRENLVGELFRLYNSSVFEEKLPEDFKITWNKKLRSTAGFCYYSRRNGVNVARIELSDKVIDTADRLRDTLIHELCHAAAWVISGVKAGHGPIWKSWAARANFVHQDLPSISRCHSYKINTKYNYRCTICGYTFGRHSKSVKLDIHRCGYCSGRLELLPQLKKDGTPAKTRAPNKFAIYVKESYSSVKKANQKMSHREVMNLLSSQFAALSTAGQET